jgi:hypothetical protein
MSKHVLMTPPSINFDKILLHHVDVCVKVIGGFFGRHVFIFMESKISEFIVSLDFSTTVVMKADRNVLCGRIQ